MATSAIRRLISSNLKNIGDMSFAGCSGLATIELQGIDSIGNRAFEQCNHIKNVSFGNEIKYVSGSAFNRTSVTNLNLHNAVIGIFKNDINDKNGYCNYFSSTELQRISSNRMKYLDYTNTIDLQFCDLPELEAIGGSEPPKLIQGITRFHKLKQIFFAEGPKIDSLYIPSTVKDGYYIDRYLCNWDALYLNMTSIGNAVIEEGNPSYIIKDSLILRLPRKYFRGNNPTQEINPSDSYTDRKSTRLNSSHWS